MKWVISDQDRTAEWCHPGEVESPTSVRIVASRPLLRAGLERLAAGADVTVLDDPGSVDVVLRAADEPADASPIDVTLVNGAVVVTCWSTPEPAVWDALGRLVAGALAD
jgi:hypothetical protein